MDGVMDGIAWLYGLQSIGVKLGLDGIRRLLAVLGGPDSDYPSVLVGGTNGKGSVAAMLDAMLLAAGARCGLYTSPHLIHPAERIRIAGRQIDPAEFDRRLVAMRVCIDGALSSGALEAQPSFFEVLTAIALDTFRDHRVEVAVLEVGLGGRLDATNAVDACLSIVVGVDLDHSSILGDTIRRIAAEKAGIVKPGRPLVSGALRQGAIDVLRDAARAGGAPWIDARVAVRFLEEGPDGLTFETATALHERLVLSLAGRHQIDNARVAVAALEALSATLGIAASSAVIREGLKTTRWPGRLQWISGEPEILLDGAHNVAGMEALAAYVRGIDRPAPVAVFGAMQDKDIEGLLDRLAPHVASIVFTRPEIHRAEAPEELARRAGDRVGLVEVVHSVPAALDRARTLAGAQRYVLVTGSLYLVGEALATLSGSPSPGRVAL